MLIDDKKRISIEVFVLVLLLSLWIAIPVVAKTVYQTDTVTAYDGEELEELIQSVNSIRDNMSDEEYRDFVLDFLEFITTNSVLKEDREEYEKNILDVLQDIRYSASENKLPDNLVVTLSENQLERLVSMNSVSVNVVSGNTISQGDIDILIENSKAQSNIQFMQLVFMGILSGIVVAGKVSDKFTWLS